MPNASSVECLMPPRWNACLQEVSWIVFIYLSISLLFRTCRFCDYSTDWTRLLGGKPACKRFHELCSLILCISYSFSEHAGFATTLPTGHASWVECLMPPGWNAWCLLGGMPACKRFHELCSFMYLILLFTGFVTTLPTGDDSHTDNYIYWPIGKEHMQDTVADEPSAVWGKQHTLLVDLRGLKRYSTNTD